MTTKLFGTKVPRVEDQRFLRGHGRYVDDVLGRAAGAARRRAPVAARPRPDRRHRRRPRCSTSRASTWCGPTTTSPAAMAEPLPLLIPHPALTHGRTQYALAKDEVNHVGEAIAFVVADDRYVAEDAVGRIRVDYELLRAGRRHRRRPRRGPAGPRRRPRQRRRPDGAGQRRRPRRDRRGARTRSTLDLTVERSACQPMEGRGVVARWDPDTGRMTVWSSTQTSTGVRGCVAAKLGLDLGQVDVDHPRRGRRLRRQDQPPVARGAAGAAGRAGARRAR